MVFDVITSNIKVELLFWNYPVNLSKWRPPDYIIFNMKYVFPQVRCKRRLTSPNIA